ncbi:hypothetical protein CHU98_g10463 [Xylaria longipes]|nr:hypothetical protein CHU98_g10463 [Xylaria longipes]
MILLSLVRGEMTGSGRIALGAWLATIGVSCLCSVGILGFFTSREVWSWRRVFLTALIPSFVVLEALIGPTSAYEIYDDISARKLQSEVAINSSTLLQTFQTSVPTRWISQATERVGFELVRSTLYDFVNNEKPEVAKSAPIVDMLLTKSMQPLVRMTTAGGSWDGTGDAPDIYIPFASEDVAIAHLVTIAEVQERINTMSTPTNRSIQFFLDFRLDFKLNSETWKDPGSQMINLTADWAERLFGLALEQYGGFGSIWDASESLVHPYEVIALGLADAVYHTTRLYCLVQGSRHDVLMLALVSPAPSYLGKVSAGAGMLTTFKEPISVEVDPDNSLLLVFLDDPVSTSVAYKDVEENKAY